MLFCLYSVYLGEVVCEPPNNKLDRFSGTLFWRDSKYTLTNQNMLLRGCVLRNTESCYGIVIYAGLCLGDTDTDLFKCICHLLVLKKLLF